MELLLLNAFPMPFKISLSFVPSFVPFCIIWAALGGVFGHSLKTKNRKFSWKKKFILSLSFLLKKNFWCCLAGSYLHNKAVRKMRVDITAISKLRDSKFEPISSGVEPVTNLFGTKKPKAVPSWKNKISNLETNHKYYKPWLLVQQAVMI